MQPDVEQCDDANTKPGDACIGCMKAVCGDGFVQQGVEACDDANADNGDACLVGCVLAVCGDGFVNVGVESGNGDGPQAGSCSCAIPGATTTDGGLWPVRGARGAALAFCRRRSRPSPC